LVTDTSFQIESDGNCEEEVSKPLTEVRQFMFMAFPQGNYSVGELVVSTWSRFC